MWWIHCLWQLVAVTATSTNTTSCGEFLKSPRGILQTPGFPAPFFVPIRCRWVIDNSQEENSYVEIYLTQVFVTSGLTFSELGYAEEGRRQGRRLMHAVTQETATTVKWLRSSWPYVSVDLALDRLEGNHLRALDNLLDVYGFNITYVVASGDEAEHHSALASCSVLECSFSGHCYATADYRHFYCACFNGFSTEDCGQGPLCEPGHSKCQINASCRQFGSAVAYYQSDCRNSIITQTCSGNRNRTMPNWAVYQITLQLTNFDSTNSSELHNTVSRKQLEKFPNSSWRKDAIINWLQEHNIPFAIENYLMENLPNITELRITNFTSAGKVVISLLVTSTAKLRFRDDLNSLLERAYLEKYSFHPKNITIKEESPLDIQDVHVNHGKTVICEGDEFILTCLARGSSAISISWLKDGVLVNISKAIRHMWIELLGPDSRGTYTAVLGVEKADVLDEGTFTCQALDLGFQQCLSISLDVLKTPQITILPRSLTVEKGGNAQLICMSGDDKKYRNFKYRWTKDNKLIRLSPGKVVWENLYPVGTILNIYNVEESGWYTCQAEDGEHSVLVAAADGDACAPELSGGRSWPGAAAASTAELDCPPPLTGVARRTCAHGCWQPPDYSSCLHPVLTAIRHSFVKLSLGYKNTTVSEILYRCLHYLEQRKHLYPGEGEQMVSFLSFVQNYTIIVTDQEDFLHSVNIFYKILNYLLETPDAIKSEKKMAQIQEILATHTVLWIGMLRTKYIHINLSAVVVDALMSYETKRLEHQFPVVSSSYPLWMNAEVNITVEVSNDEYFKISNITTLIIVYKNMSAFLHENHALRQRNGQKLWQLISSTMVVIRILINDQEWQPKYRSFAAAMKISHGQPLLAVPVGWRPLCMEIANTTSSCTTVAYSNEYTTCYCTNPGSYTVIYAAVPSQEESPAVETSLSVVVVGCVICLVQTLSTLILLLPSWWRHRNCFIFLKLQCCAATSGAMAIFLYGVRNSPTKNSSYVAVSLEALLLVGTTSHLGKVLIVYVEVAQISRSLHVNKIIASTTIGFSLLAVMCIHFTHHFLECAQTSWWLIFRTKMFIMFTTILGFTLAVYVFLHIFVTRRLRLFSRSMILDSRTVGLRIRFLNRGATILLFMVMMEAASILYINFHIVLYSYLFGCSSAFLGFVIASCYLWKSEIPLCDGMTHNSQPTDSTSEENISTITQPKSSTTQEEVLDVSNLPESSSNCCRLKICTNIQNLILKVRKDSVTTVPLCDVNMSRVETIVSTGGDFLDDTISSGFHPNTSALRCSAVKSTGERSVVGGDAGFSVDGAVATRTKVAITASNIGVSSAVGPASNSDSASAEDPEHSEETEDLLDEEKADGEKHTANDNFSILV